MPAPLGRPNLHIQFKASSAQLTHLVTYVPSSRRTATPKLSAPPGSAPNQVIFGHHSFIIIAAPPFIAGPKLQHQWIATAPSLPGGLRTRSVGAEDQAL